MEKLFELDWQSNRKKYPIFILQIEYSERVVHNYEIYMLLQGLLETFPFYNPVLPRYNYLSDYENGSNS
jgi:hypothetical protein